MSTYGKKGSDLGEQSYETIGLRSGKKGGDKEKGWINKGLHIGRWTRTKFSNL